MHHVLHLEIKTTEGRYTDMNFGLCKCVQGVLSERVSCLGPVQKEGDSPVQPGCGGLCSPDDEIHSGHVHVSVREEL